MRLSSLSPKFSIVIFAMPLAAAEMRSKLCITPLGWPVDPEVYMIMAKSVGARAMSPINGAVWLTTSSHFVKALLGAKGKAMQGKFVGTKGACNGHVSSLPTNKKLASLWSNTKRMVSPDSVGKMATVVPPAIQMANSAMMKCAQFFERIATRSPGFNFCACRYAAIERACRMVSCHV